MTSAMNSRDAIQLIDASWNDWLAAIGAVPEERWSEAGVCGVWSIKDLLGHLAVWDRHALDDLKLFAAGELIPDIDVDEVNNREAGLRAHRSIAEQRREMEDSHAALLAYLPAAAGIDLSEIGGDTWDHYPDHTGQVTAWSEML